MVRAAKGARVHNRIARPQDGLVVETVRRSQARAEVPVVSFGGSAAELLEANASAPRWPPAAELARFGSKKDIRLFTSVKGLKRSQRRPRFSVRRELTFQSSWIYAA